MYYNGRNINPLLSFTPHLLLEKIESSTKGSFGKKKRREPYWLAEGRGIVQYMRGADDYLA